VRPTVPDPNTPTRFQQLRDRHEWVDHLVRAGARYTQRRGNDYAAAVTYFSVLSLVPVTMVAFAAASRWVIAQLHLASVQRAPDRHGDRQPYSQ
jgi:membrane protein